MITESYITKIYHPSSCPPSDTKNLSLGEKARA